MAATNLINRVILDELCSELPSFPPAPKLGCHSLAVDAWRDQVDKWWRDKGVEYADVESWALAFAAAQVDDFHSLNATLRMNFVTTVAASVEHTLTMGVLLREEIRVRSR